jgi:predicted RND superfamily exporter protein
MNYNDEFTIIVDTREQQPWEFEYYSKANRKLDTGDYSIEGLENIFTIERKKSVAEIANNISEKRFDNALARLKEYKYKFLLLEFSLDNVLDYPIGSTVPKKTWEKLKITSKYILKYLTKIAIEYNIQVIFCGNKDAAEEMAISIMKRVFEKYNHE